MNEYERNYHNLMQLLDDHPQRQIENEPFLPLTIEKLEGQPLISLCHYGEQNGDLMRDPEVVFLLHNETAKPAYFRNDHIGMELATVERHFGDVPVKSRLQKELDGFCRVWWANIEHQGFFDRAKELRANETISQASTPEPDAGPDMEP